MASQKSTVVPIRLRPHEIAMLDRILKSDSLVAANRSEVIRLLIHREFLRRTTGTSVVLGRDIASDHRLGRPSNKPMENPAS